MNSHPSTQPDRRLPGRSKADRLVDGLLGAADDLETDLPVDVRLLVAERLRRLAAEVAQLHARDLVRIG